MITINHILGHSHDPELSNSIHELSHQSKVEYIILDHTNLQRRRFRIMTDQGTDCAVTLSREEKLSNGAVLMLDQNRAIIVKMSEDQWLSLQPKDLASAIELGYFAGNMHWRVKFEQSHIDIALEGPEEVYLDRLKIFFKNEKITRIKHD
jgi:urease accessory protein